jgi:hypothetical protein
MSNGAHSRRKEIVSVGELSTNGSSVQIREFLESEVGPRLREGNNRLWSREADNTTRRQYEQGGGDAHLL